MESVYTLTAGESHEFRGGALAIRIANPSKTARGAAEIIFLNSSRQTFREALPPGGSLTQANARGSAVQVVNRGKTQLLIQPVYAIELVADGLSAERYSDLWSAFDASGFQVQPCRTERDALPDRAAVVYAPDAAGNQWPVAMQIREILQAQGVSDVALVDADSLSFDLPDGNFIVVPAAVTCSLRTLTCVQVYHEPERTRVALVNGIGWLEYDADGARVIVADAWVVHPPQTDRTYFIASVDGTAITQFRNMACQSSGPNNTYVFTCLNS